MLIVATAFARCDHACFALLWVGTISRCLTNLNKQIAIGDGGSKSVGRLLERPKSEDVMQHSFDQGLVSVALSCVLFDLDF